MVGTKVMDITEVILYQHHEQRRMFATLDEIDSTDTERLSAVWRQLAILLDIHAKAEEHYFYPALLRLGQGPKGENGPDDETEDAIKDHNEIRDAITQTDSHPVGTQDWWKGIRTTRVANGDHMAEEERDDLADFRRHADLSERHDVAVEFLGYIAQHAAGIHSRNPDPASYVAEHS